VYEEVWTLEDLPLTGIRVADFTRVHAGPSATQWLGVLGAEVLRLESRMRPDMLRPDRGRGRVEVNPDLDSSNSFLSLNCSKLSCTLNLTNPKAVELAKRIIAVCDGVFENYSPGVMARFGLDYPSVKRLKPDIIMLSCSGPGQTGPNRHEVAFAHTVQAFSGLCSITGYPGGAPTQIGPMWADVMAGQAAVFAFLTALYHRDETGEGQYIDLSMNETILSTMPEAILEFTLNGRNLAPMGNRDWSMAPHGCYRCQGEDCWVAIAVGTDEEWQALCRVMGNPAWCAEERFADQVSRWYHQDELDHHLEAWTQSYTREAAARLLQEAGVPAAISAGPADVFHDPHLRERQFFTPLEHPRVGKSEVGRVPYRPDGHFVSQYKPAPLIGQHNQYVFAELLGMPEGEIEALVDERVIY